MLPRRARKKSSRRPNRSLAPFERRLFTSVLVAGAPGSVLGLYLLWRSAYSLDHKLEITALLLFLWIRISISVRDSVVRAIQVLSNVVAALKENDFSFRANNEVRGDAFGDLAIEINNLSRALEQERLQTIDSSNLLRQVMAEVGSVILTFTPDSRVHLLNHAAAVFLGAPEAELLGRSAQELGIADLFEGPSAETISRAGANMEETRWVVRRKQFRRHGIPHQLIVLSEVSEALREEERFAWQRLIRVLSHEINNSLAPIKSLARTLRVTAVDTAVPGEARDNLEQGLEIIGTCAESLNRFVQSYARVSRLPAPSPRKTRLDTLIERVAALEARVPVTLVGGPPCEMDIDSDQMQQALINVIRNGADAVLQRGSAPESDSVTIGWFLTASHVEVRIKDQGPGLAETENLFVPFYTTKANGSGIGLFLSRQIIEAHGGVLHLRNRSDRRGCEVEIRLPLSRETAAAASQSAYDFH
jgi:two-component system nitrogen regulation sensor histidine kinase NtrY